MILGYECHILLVDPQNAQEVSRILDELDSDLISPEILQYQRELVDRLWALGEAPIAERCEEVLRERAGWSE